MEQEIGENIIEKHGHKWKLIPRLTRLCCCKRRKGRKLMKKGQTITLRSFARLLGYTKSSDREFKTVLKILTSKELIKIQQSGFYAHSCHHPKILIILEPFEVDRFKRIILGRTNFKIRDFTVHRTTKKRKCDGCNKIINYGQRYGIKLKIGRRALYVRRRKVFGGTTLCFPCLIEKFGVEDWDIW